MKRITVWFMVVVLSILPLIAVEMGGVDDYQNFSSHWNGSTSSGYVMSIGIPSDVQTSKRVYPFGVSIVSSVDMDITVRIGSTSDATGGEAPVKLNTTQPAVFTVYKNSNVGTSGDIVTTYPFKAGVAYTIGLEGVVLPSGRTTKRNLSVHIPALAGTAYITWKVGQR